MRKKDNESTADRIGCFGEFLELIVEIIAAIFIFGD